MYDTSQGTAQDGNGYCRQQS